VSQCLFPDSHDSSLLLGDGYPQEIKYVYQNLDLPGEQYGPYTEPYERPGSARSGRCITASVELFNLTTLRIAAEAVLAGCAGLGRDGGQQAKTQVDTGPIESQQKESREELGGATSYKLALA
jgi:hypothetical protein